MEFLVRLQESAKAGEVDVLSTSADHDPIEIFHRRGRVDTRRQLASAQAAFEASFRVPLVALSPRESLLVPSEGHRPGRLLLTDDRSQSDPGVDVIAHLADDDRFLRDWLGPELRREGLLGRDGWGDLDRTWRLTHAVRARRDGVWCDLRIDLDVR